MDQGTNAVDVSFFLQIVEITDIYNIIIRSSYRMYIIFYIIQIKLTCFVFGAFPFLYKNIFTKVYLNMLFVSVSLWDFVTNNHVFSSL